MIRVQVLADSPLVRAGLEAMLRASPGIELVTGADADVLVLQADQLPDELPGGAPVVLIATLADPQTASDALRLGVRAILPPDADPEEISAAIEAVAQGLIAIPASALDVFLRPHTTREASTESLTPRELEVLRLLAEGHSNKEIAFRMSISEHTVKFHVAAVLAKLRASTRTEAVMLGIRQGLVLI